MIVKFELREVQVIKRLVDEKIIELDEATDCGTDPQHFTAKLSGKPEWLASLISEKKILYGILEKFSK